ncbi:hypothetical protein MBLNU230_g6148t1 [Neophaeotheca triangularis]
MVRPPKPQTQPIKHLWHSIRILPLIPSPPFLVTQAQTPQQRKANIQYARNEEAKRGKPIDDQKRITKAQQEKEKKSPISPVWLYIMLFVICGGLIVELLRIFFG